MDAGSRRPADILFGKIDDMRSRVAAAIDAARKHLLASQHEDGYWCGELEADTTLDSDYILLHALLGTGRPERIQKAAAWILAHQNQDGGWGIHPGAAASVSASVKAYFGLKLAGYPAEHPALVRARQKILELGGVTQVNTFTKINLCFFGQYDYETVPAVPPEIVLFPNWFWFNIYEISSWSRGILVPLSIAYAKKPFKKIPDEMGVQELFLPGTRTRRGMRLKWDKQNKLGWRNFFLVLNAMTHWFERVHVRPLRSLALQRAEKWMLARFEMSDGLAAIYPAVMNSIIAMRCLGYSLDDPQMIRALDEFEALGIEEETTFRMQPCQSPVWDTAYAAFALAESGVAPGDPRLIAAADWLLSKEVRHKGDWAVKVRHTEPGGWYFEFNNEFYPDVDDIGHGAAGAQPHREPARALSARGGAARHRLDLRHAVPGRGLGLLRPRQHQDGLPVHPLRRPQRHARPAHRGRHRAGAGNAGQRRLRQGRAVRPQGHRLYPQAPGGGWLLVRPLGRELHLRHLAGAARPAKRSGWTTTSPTCSRRRSGCA